MSGPPHAFVSDSPHGRAAWDGDTPTPSPAAPHVDGYRLLSPLGRGGMGQVFVAARAQDDERVAIKLLRSEHAADAQLRARFAQEAAVLSRLAHPGIVRVLSCGELPDHTLFLVMELLPGPSLRSYLRERGPLALAQVLHIGRQVSAALAAAHAQGIVHRDLKPENLMLTGPAPGADSAPAIKVVDFGLAKAPWLPAGSRTQLVTSAGAVLGTVPYMAPEQFISAAAVDAAADVYALGLILCELLAGRLPFDPDNPHAAWQWHQDRRAPLPVGPQAPFWLRVLLTGMLERDPRHRPAMAAVRDRLADHAVTWALRDPRRWLRRAGRARAALGAALVLGYLGLNAYRSQRDAMEQKQAEVLQVVRDLDREAARQPGMVPGRRQALWGALRQVRQAASPALAVELGHLYHRFSELEMNHGATAAARQWHEEAARALPLAGAALKAHLAYWEGGLAKQEGRLAVAERAYQQALIARGPALQDDEALRTCAIAHEGLGQVRLHQGQTAEAEAEYQAAERCEAQRPGPREGYRRFVAAYHQFRLGEAAEQAGALARAAERLRMALRLGEPLAAQPSALYRAHQARYAAALSRVLLRCGDVAGAAQWVDQGLRLSESALELEPMPLSERALAESEESAALLAEARGGDGEAPRARALARRRALWRQDPHDGLAGHDLALALAESLARRQAPRTAVEPDSLRAELRSLLQALADRGILQDDQHLTALRRLPPAALAARGSRPLGFSP